MSYRTMLKQRCTIRRLVEGTTNGYSTFQWVTVEAGVACFLDLNFIRQGKDPMWVPEAGRPADRTGVWFGMPNVDVRSGDQLVMTKGPAGTFQIEGAVDQVWRPGDYHHLEIGVKEVGRPVATGGV
jgi:hypothetical protein